MDPFTIISGLAAVLQLCGTARAVVKVAHRFSRNAGGASADVRRFAIQVQIFSDVVEAAEFSLQSYCTKNQKSPLVVFIHSRGILDNIGEEAKAVQEHLRDIRARVRSLGSSSILWASIKWTWNKSSILELVPEMESVKGSLNLLLAISGFEERTGAGRNASDEEIRKSRRLIKHSLKTMELLHSQLEQVSQFNASRPYQHHASATLVHQALIELGWSVYDYGTPPDSPEASPSSSGDRLRPPTPRPRRPDRSQENLHISIRHPHPPATATSRTRSTHTRPASSRAPVPISQRRRTPPSPPGPPPPGSPPSPRQPPPSQRSSQQPPPPQLQSPARAQPDPAGSSARTPPTDSLPPSNITHYLPARLLTDAITGYVSSPTRTSATPENVNPFLVSTLACNLISLGEARRLGLDVQPHHERGGVAFDFGRGAVESSVGRTELLWRGSMEKDGRRPPLAVECEVCENVMVRLVLGRPFIEERGRRWIRR